MQLSEPAPHFPSASIAHGIANKSVQGNQPATREHRSLERIDEQVQGTQLNPAISSPRLQYRPPPIRTEGLSSLHRSQSTITTRRDRTAAIPRLIEAGLPLEQHISRKRTLDSAGLDEINLPKPLGAVRSPVAESWTSSASSSLCLCQPDPKIPRPRNAFILYRQHIHQDILAQYPGIQNPDVSKKVGELWNSEPEEGKNYWRRIAEEEKARHAQQFPDYRYRPRHKGKGAVGPGSPTEHTYCNKCGGRAISGLSTSNSPGLASEQIPLVRSNTLRSSLVSPRGFPPATSLEIQSSSSPLSPYSASDTRGAMSELHKKRKYNGQFPPGTPGPPVQIDTGQDGDPRALSGAIQPSAVMYAPFRSTPSLPARRDSLPLPTSPMVFTRGLRELGYPTRSSQGSISRLPMAPPPTPASRMSLSGPSLNQEQGLARTSSAGNVSPAGGHAVPPTPRFPLAQGGGRDSLRLPPLHGPLSQGQSMDTVIMSMSFREKIKILRRVVIPIPHQAPDASNSSRQRGVIISVEGDKNAPVAAVVARLEEYLNRTGEFEVTTVAGPKLPGSDATIGQYIEEIARWHQNSQALIDKVAGARWAETYQTTTEKAPQEEQLANQSSITKTLSSDHKDHMDVDVSPTDTSTMARRKSLTSSATLIVHDASIQPLGHRGSSTTQPSADKRAWRNSRESERSPIVLIPCYLVGASNAWSIALPLKDMYSVKDHWQWTATLWRGVPGPDFTIYVRNDDPQHQKDASVPDRSSNIEILEEAGLMVIKTAKEGSSNVADVAAVRRLAFEVGEWARAASCARAT